MRRWSRTLSASGMAMSSAGVGRLPNQRFRVALLVVSLRCTGALDQPPLALDRLESHRVEIGNDQRAQLEKFEERLEQIGIGAAELEQGDILRADLSPAARLPPSRGELAEDLRDKN